jgi:hypothetical protein
MECIAEIGTKLIVAAMRTGYAARGVLYGAVGILALAASAGGGPAPGLVGTVERLGELSWDKPLRFALALGLMLYAVWRGLDAAVDLVGRGPGFGGVGRFGLAFVALLYMVFASYVARLAIRRCLGAGRRRHARRARRPAGGAPDRALAGRAGRRRHDLARRLFGLEGREPAIPPAPAADAAAGARRASDRLRARRARRGLLGDPITLTACT